MSLADLRGAPNWVVGILCLAILPGVGCGAGGTGNGMPNLVPQAPVITTQPANTTVPVGQSGVFRVAANGTAPVNYQWSKNNQPVAGAISASYNTPIVVPGDEGAVFSVAVTNAIGSALSQAATLTVGPRSPLAGDLRFQQVDAPSTFPGYAGYLDTAVLPGNTLTFTNFYGTPLFMGEGHCAPVNVTDCSWFLSSFLLPAGVSGLTVSYSSDLQANLIANLGALPKTSTVVTSIDLEPANGTFAMSTFQASQVGAFDVAAQSVAPSALQAAATREGAGGRVITAVSYNSGQIYYLSYGWTGDPSTSYDCVAVTTTIDQVPTAAIGLAADGYILTAFGSGDTGTDGFVLVGTRVHGDSLPRPLTVVPQGQQNELWNEGFAIVGVFSDANGNTTWMGEK
jgi:hypothetical protein